MNKNFNDVHCSVSDFEKEPTTILTIEFSVSNRKTVDMCASGDASITRSYRAQVLMKYKLKFKIALTKLKTLSLF